MKKIKNILFDLDGTLLNSIGDITYCVNTSLRHFNLPELNIKVVSECVGGGLEALVYNVFNNLYNIYVDHEYLNSKKEDFKKYYMSIYLKNSIINGNLYDGVNEGLKKLYNSNMQLYVVSNKPHDIAVDCIYKLGVQKYFKKVIGDGYYDVKKPDKALWRKLEEEFKIKTDNTVMIGDGIQDIEFARNVSIEVLVVLYGGITKEKILIDMKEKNYFNSFNSMVEYVLNFL